MSFQDKVAIVTGAGQGIGFGICKELALQGAQVFLNDVDPDLTAKAVDAINEVSNGRCTGIAGNAGDYVFIQQIVATVVEQTGRLDIVVANAGITLFGDFFTYQPGAFHELLQVNLAGSFFLTQAAANQMKQQASGGSILFMSSVTGHQAHKNLAAYGMSKAALEMLAKNLVIELSPFQININTVAPGATLTERTLNDPAYQSTWSRITPMGRPASVADIVHAALFLVSDTAKHITGQTLIVDGGWTCVSVSPD